MAEVIKKKKIKTTNSSKDIYYGVENCKYINTNGANSQTLADKLSSTDTNISNIQDALSNESTGLIKRVNDIEKDFAEFETVFQDGVSEISKHFSDNYGISGVDTPSEITNAVDKVYDMQFNNIKKIANIEWAVGQRKSGTEVIESSFLQNLDSELTNVTSTSEVYVEQFKALKDFTALCTGRLTGERAYTWAVRKKDASTEAEVNLIEISINNSLNWDTRIVPIKKEDIITIKCQKDDDTNMYSISAWGGIFAAE